MKTIYIPLTCCIFLFSGCEIKEENTENSLLVVEGYLFQGEPVDSVHLTLTLPFESSDTVFEPVTEAGISIYWDGRQYILDNIGNGYYSYSGEGLSVNQGENYSISILYRGREITSSTIVPLMPEGVELSDTIVYVDTTFSFGPPGQNDDDSGVVISWTNPDNSYFYVLIENSDSTASDIEFDTGDFPSGFEPPSRMFTFRSEPFQGNEYTINPRLLEKYGKHKIKIYRVNQEYADLYENRQQDSRNLTEPNTNIKGGLGIFTAFSYAEAYFSVENKTR